MKLTEKTLRRAKNGIREAHVMFHRASGDKPRAYQHEPGYTDGVGAMILARLDELEERFTKILLKRKRAPTKWQMFLGTKLHQGASIGVAAKEWRARKRKRRASAN